MSASLSCGGIVARNLIAARQHLLAFLPLPHGHFSLRPGVFSRRIIVLDSPRRCEIQGCQIRRQQNPYLRLRLASCTIRESH